MSNKNIQKFYKAIQSDTALQSQFNGITSRNSLIQLAMKLGTKHGYHFTAEEAAALLTAGENELSDDQAVQ